MSKTVTAVQCGLLHSIVWARARARARGSDLYLRSIGRGLVVFYLRGWQLRS